MLSKWYRIIAAAGLALTLDACGHKGSSAAAGAPAPAATQQQVSTAEPALWPDYFMPREWAEQVQSGRLNSSEPDRLQIVAMFLYQNPQALNDDKLQQLLVGLYSCADHVVAEANEIRAPALKAAAVAKFRSFLSTAMPSGIAKFQVKLGRYDTAGQRFSWSEDGGDQPLAIGSVDGNLVASCQGGALADMDGTYRIIMKGANLSGLALNAAAADRYLQANPNRYIDMTVHFTVPRTPAEGAALDQLYPNILADADFKQADFFDPHDHRPVTTASR